MYKKCRVINRVQKPCVSAGLCVANVRSATPMDSLLISTVSTPNDTDRSVKYMSDVYILLNQKRLDKMSLDLFSNYLDSISSMPQSDGLSQLRGKVSDSDLLKFVKSRYIQSQSELQAWAKYLTSQAASLGQDIKAYIESVTPNPSDPEPSSPSAPAE